MSHWFTKKIEVVSIVSILLIVLTGAASWHIVPAWAATPDIANPIPNQSATEDAAFNFQFAANTFNDDDGDSFTYTSQLAGGGALPGWLSFDAATRTFSGTPSNANVGTISVDVIANDGNGGTVTDTFNLDVANTNDAPTVANIIPNQSATEDSAFNYQFASNTFNDADAGNTLTYSAQLAGGGALPAWLSFDAVTRTFSGTPANTNVGTVSIDAIASDGNGGTVTDTFNITVANTNDAPTVANAISDQSATEDIAFNFQFAANSFNDIDVGDSLTYSAQLAGGGALPAWLSFNTATRTFSGTPDSADVGTVSIDVMADDGNGGTVTDTFDIVVAAQVSDTCTWTGSTSANWATGSNWTGCDNGGVPEDGDTLVFPSSALNKVTNNDLSSLEVSTITISGTGYTIDGNALTLTSTIPVTANESATISADVIYDSGSHVNILPAADKLLTLSGATSFVLTGMYEVNVGSPGYTGSVDFTGVVSGDAAAQFIAINGATLKISGSSNTFLADQVGAESTGNFQCSSAACFGDSSNDIYMGGGAVDILVAGSFGNDFRTSSTTADVSALVADGNVTLNGSGTINDDLLIVQSSASTTLLFTGTATLNGSIEIEGADLTSIVKFDGVMSGAGGLTAKSGLALLSASNTFAGTVTVKDGAVVEADQANSLGATSAPTVVEDGGSLHIRVTGNTTIAEPLQTAGEGVSPMQFRGAVYNTSPADVILSGDIALADDTLIHNAAYSPRKLTIRGIISGSHALTVHGGNGTNTQIGDSGDDPNTYTGTTRLTGGQILLEKTLAIPGNLVIQDEDAGNSAGIVVSTYAPNAIADSGTVTLINLLDILRIGDSGTTEVIGGLSGAGIIMFQHSDGNLAIDQDFDSTFSGDFSAGGNSPDIIKRGTGNLVFAGEFFVPGSANNMNFVVGEGTMTVNGHLSSDDGADVLVKNTGTLKGTGKVGTLSTTGGTLAPGNSPGKLNVASLLLDATSTMDIELDGPVAGTSYDQIVASGAVDLADATLNIKPGYTPSAGQVFTIITGLSVTGTFKNLANSSTVTANGLTFRINYNATDVTLTYLSGAITPTANVTGGTKNTNGTLADTGTNIVLTVTASLMLIIAATVLVLRRRYKQVM